MPTKSSEHAHGRPSFDSPSQEVFLNLWRTYDRLKAVEDEVFGRYKLSAQQYNALRLLDSAWPKGTQTMELGRRLISRMPDTTRMLDRLEKSKLITRQRLADNRRVVEVYITSHGRQLLSELAPLVTEMHERQLGHLSANQQKQLVNLLKIARRPHEDESCDWLEH